jgi:hypothetical protein
MSIQDLINMIQNGQHEEVFANATREQIDHLRSMDIIDADFEMEWEHYQNGKEHETSYSQDSCSLFAGFDTLEFNKDIRDLVVEF